MSLCKCSCGKEIQIKPHHKYQGIPKYIKGHNPSSTTWKKGNTPWNKGLRKVMPTPWNKGTKGVMRSYRQGASLDSEYGEERADDIRQKLSNSHKGQKAWNKNKKMSDLIPNYVHPNKDKKASDEIKFKMRNSRITYIQKQYFENRRMTPCIGKLKTPILDALETCFGYEIERQYKVVGYFIDGYCPALNLAIEIDEPFHMGEEQMSKDIYRENIIKNELGCNFTRVSV